MSKALGLIGRSVDTLDRRALLGRFHARGAVDIPGLLHFSMIPVVALDQDDGGVTLQVSGPDGDRRRRAGYVVGCDGGSSVVRKQAGIGFPGIPLTFLLRLGDVTLAGGLTPQEPLDELRASIRRVNGADVPVSGARSAPRSEASIAP